MKITDAIRNIFKRREEHVLHTYGYVPFEWQREHLPFGECLYFNITELLTDIYSEVLWMPLAGYDTPKFRAWKQFVDTNGQRILGQLLNGAGYVVIAWKKAGDGSFVFFQLKTDEYRVERERDEMWIRAKDESVLYYVLRSPTYEMTGKSDKEWCRPFIKYLDNVLNGSNSVSERMGVFVTASPKDPANSPMATNLSAEEKKELEEQLQRDYGYLRRQNIAMLLPRPMEFQTINLSGLDLRTAEKARLAISAICDRIKVPANQVAIIDAASSKTLSNGTELREGDLSKYRSFRRLLNSTWFDMATEIGLQVDYVIENEPLTTQGQNIEQ